MPLTNKPNRFQIQKLEDRVAPTLLGLGTIGVADTTNVSFGAGVNVLGLATVNANLSASNSLGASISL